MPVWETENVLERIPLYKSLLLPPKRWLRWVQILRFYPIRWKNRILKLRRLTERHPQVTSLQ